MTATPRTQAHPRILVVLAGPKPGPALQALGETTLAPEVMVLSPAVADEGEKLGERLRAQGRFAALHWQPLTPGEDWRARANGLLASRPGRGRDACPDFLFLLSASVRLEGDALAVLVRRLMGEPELAGVSPLLLSPPGDAPRRVRHLGTVFDSQREAHSLYEGIAADHPLAQKNRVFQVGPEAALLLRLDAFCAAGGFSPDLGDLAPLDLCFRLGNGRAAFATEPAALATLADFHSGLRTAACWNSLMERGRIPKGHGVPDCHLHVLADGLRYGFTPWLHEGPDLAGLLPEGESRTDAWLAWRHAQDPWRLLRLLAKSGPEELARLVAVCRAFPSLLPHAFAWYSAQARQMEDFGRSGGIAEFAAEAARWLKGQARFHHRLLKPGMRALADAGLWACSLDAAASAYDAWQELREPGFRAPQVTAGEAWPEIAVLMPVWNPRPAHLAAALDSVLAQSYGRWQLCIADDASTDPVIPEMLRAYAARDARIRLVIREENGHISRASNSALGLVDAPWTALLDHDDLLAPTALAETAATIAKKPGLALVYTDEDRIDENGVRRSPIFKPGFDPDLFSVGHLHTWATALLREAGGLRPGFEGSQDLDLWLRITERLDPREVAHIPRVLYHWRVHPGSTAGSLAAKPYVLAATQMALSEAAERRGHRVEGLASERNAFFRVLLGVPPGLSCSVILLADESCVRGPGKALVDALEALCGKMQVEALWQPLAAGPTKPSRWPGRTLPPPRPLSPAAPHWAGACLAAAREATGEVLLFLHAALVPVAGCRPEQLVIQALRRDVSLVGGLIWKGGKLWNGGYAPDVTGLPFPLLRGAFPQDLQTHDWGRFFLTRHMLGVAWQCMALRRRLLLEPWALDALMGSLAGVDYSLRQEAEGRFSLISPWGQWELDPEAAGEALIPEAQARFLARWGETVRRHPLRNANLCAAPDHGWRLMLNEEPGP